MGSPPQGENTGDGNFKSVTVDNLNVKTLLQFGGSDLYKANEFVEVQVMGVASESNATVSNTSFQVLYRGTGGFDLDIPAAATAYGLFFADGKIDDGADTFTVQPEVVDTSRNFDSLAELKITFGSTSSSVQSSGWTELTSITTDDQYIFDVVKGKTSDGTATGTINVGRVGLLVGWRL